MKTTKVAVITGGNAGLGLACAAVIARDPAYRVVLACRDSKRGGDAAAELRRRTGNPNVEAMELDLASLASVRRFAATFTGSIDALVLNAGLQVVTGRTTTEDGFETTFAVNHLGHFLLANLLLAKVAPRGRIVFVSSDTHDPTHWTGGMPHPRFVDPSALSVGDDLPDEPPGRAGRRRYTTSKLCNVYCAYEMQRRVAQQLPDRGITVNAFDPGFMPLTGLARDYGLAARLVATFVLPIFIVVLPNAHLVRTSGRRLARLAIDPSYEALSGRYVSRGRDTPSSPDSYDQANAHALWDASVAMTKLTAAESPLA